MTPTAALNTLIRPTLVMLGAPFVSLEAECLLLAIGLVESRFTYRHQDMGPARGFWQFETEAVRDFVQNGDDRLRDAVSKSGVMLEMSVLYIDIAYPKGDRAACIMARDLLWRDPAPLPIIGASTASWQYYLRNWRPGKPSYERWVECYNIAAKLLGE